MGAFAGYVTDFSGHSQLEKITPLIDGKLNF